MIKHSLIITLNDHTMNKNLRKLTDLEIDCLQLIIESNLEWSLYHKSHKGVTTYLLGVEALKKHYKLPARESIIFDLLELQGVPLYSN